MSDSPFARVRDSIVGHAWGALDRLATTRPPVLDQPSRILIIKLCCLGDVVFATAVVDALRRRFPAAQIGFAVNRHARPAVEADSRIAEIVDCGDLGTGRALDLRGYFNLVGRVRDGRWDAAFVLERSGWFSLLPRLAGIPFRAGIDSGGRGVGLTHRAPWIEGHHEVDVYLEVVRAAGIDPESSRPEFVPSADDQAWAAAKLARFEGGRFAVLHPGGGVNPGMALAAKRWPLERYVETGRSLLERRFAIVVVGAASEDSCHALVAALTGAGELVLDLVGQTTFGQLAAIASRASLWVGNDSGPTQLAAASGAPTIAIFGPSSPEMYGPRGKATRSLWQPPACSPCFLRGRFNEGCQDWVCIRGVSVDQVLAAAEELTQDSALAPESVS